MNKYFLLFMLLHIMRDTMAQNKIELKDNWIFSIANENVWHSAHIPGNIFSDLLRHSKIANPLLGTNEKEAQWVSQQDWEYKIDNIQFSCDTICYI